MDRRRGADHRCARGRPDCGRIVGNPVVTFSWNDGDGYCPDIQEDPCWGGGTRLRRPIATVQHSYAVVALMIRCTVIVETPNSAAIWRTLCPWWRNSLALSRSRTSLGRPRCSVFPWRRSLAIAAEARSLRRTRSCLGNPARTGKAPGDASCVAVGLLRARDSCAPCCPGRGCGETGHVGAQARHVRMMRAKWVHGALGARIPNVGVLRPPSSALSVMPPVGAAVLGTGSSTLATLLPVSPVWCAHCAASAFAARCGQI
jgi:hypothetical protein